ncbi:hypothetical protein [Cryptosporangium sp. NPDC048952]|uniref:hypothetical protein n=1 Tax=Cryptosporangium sp. NPDC048952 TaxID=3363961 RepID=UPI003723D599
MTPTRRRPARRWALALAAVLGCAACSTGTSAPSSPAEPPDPSATGTGPAVQFTSAIEADGQQLHVHYRLVNESAGNLVVLNRAASPSDGGFDDPNAVYVTGRGSGGQVEVSKRAFAMPDTEKKSWANPARVGGTLVPRGGAAEESFTVSLPLRRYHPYGDDYGDGPVALPDPVTGVRFCLGVLPGNAVDPAGPTPGVGPVTLPHLGSTTRVQHLFCSAQTDL